MSEIHITCPACHSTLKIDELSDGKEVQCGACMEVFIAKGKPAPVEATSDAEDDAGPANRRSRRRRSRRDDDEDYDYRGPRRRAYVGERKSRLVYILLALFLGSLGVHNFYAGRTAIGVGQLLITMVSIPLMCVIVGFVTIFIPQIWAIIDIIVVERDGDNVPMES